MPIMNIYGSREELAKIEKHVGDLRRHAATELTTTEIALDEHHISVRLLCISGQMIGDLEVEIHAHAFAGRVCNRDKIASKMRAHIEDVLPSSEIRIWLLLSEIGYAYNRNTAPGMN